ncbi:MAG: AEC family transporter [Oscillospiraceae bacterium]|nr:AEC family transporter [Oscillospiraceae bacterium]
MSGLIGKMAVLFVLLVTGYLCARLKIVGAEFNKGLSKLVMNVFLAATILDSVINKELTLSGKELGFGILMMCLAMLITLGIAYVTPTLLGIKTGDRGMYRLLVAFMNNAFVGFPVVTALYGEESLFFASLLNIPFNLLLYSVGVMMLKSGEKGGFNIKKAINTPIIATLLAALIFTLRIPVPTIIDDVCGTLAAATVPLSMMCVGISLGPVSVKDALSHPRLYALSLVRLIVCPLAVWFVLHFFISDPVSLGIIVALMATPTAIVCTILGLENGRDGIESSEEIFISTTLSMITIPVIMSFLT